MWVRRWHWRELMASAAQASSWLFELEQAQAEAVELHARVARLERENTELRRTLRHLNPGAAWEGDTDPSRLYIPREVTEELAESEAAVVPCPTCGQPHGSGGVCAGDVKEAA